MSSIPIPNAHPFAQRSEHRVIFLFLPYVGEGFAVLEFEVVFFCDTECRKGNCSLAFIMDEKIVGGEIGERHTLGKPPKALRIPGLLPLLLP